MSRLRQVVTICPDLTVAEAEACKELESFVTFRDKELEMFGLENALLPLGGVPSFLEICAPLQDKSCTNSSGARFLSKYGAGGYMVIVQLDGPAAMQRALAARAELGLRADVHEGARTAQGLISKRFNTREGPGITQDGIAGFHLHPKDAGCIAELAVNKPRTRWTWAGDDWAFADNRTKIAHSSTLGFSSVVIATANPEKVAANWQALLGLPSDKVISTNDNTQLVLDDESVLEFRKPMDSKESGLVRLVVYTSSSKIRNGVTKTIAGLDVEFKHPFGDSHL